MHFCPWRQKSFPASKVTHSYKKCGDFPFLIEERKIILHRQISLSCCIRPNKWKYFHFKRIRQIPYCDQGPKDWTLIYWNCSSETVFLAVTVLQFTPTWEGFSGWFLKATVAHSGENPLFSTGMTQDR